jgi:ADP-ribosylglycohydrolase
MLGAIAGDIIGSVYEFSPIKRTDFPLFSAESTFTDDTVLTVAVAEWLLDGGDLAQCIRVWARRYPGMSYGGMFRTWMRTDGAGPYGSWGNGAPMRVAAVAYVAKTEAEAIELAARSAAVTHDHPDGIVGAQATALAAFLARDGATPKRIRAAVEARFGYDLAPSVAAIRPGYSFDESAKGTVPAALICALEAADFEGTVRNAVSLGGDADTLACIAGAVAEPLHGLPGTIGREAWVRLDGQLSAVVERFYAQFIGRVPKK